MSVRVIEFADPAHPTTQRRLKDLPDRVVAGDPHHTSTRCYENGAGDMRAGIWTSTAGKWHAFTGKDEFCYIVKGHVRLIGEDGHIQTFKTGDSFLIPNGFQGYWEVVEETTKHFVVRDYES